MIVAGGRRVSDEWLAAIDEERRKAQRQARRARRAARRAQRHLAAIDELMTAAREERDHA